MRLLEDWCEVLENMGEMVRNSASMLYLAVQKHYRCVPDCLASIGGV